MWIQLEKIYKLPETHIWVYGCCNEGGLPTVPGAVFGLLLEPANLSYRLRLPVAAAECSKGVAIAEAGHHNPAIWLYFSDPCHPLSPSI